MRRKLFNLAAALSLQPLLLPVAAGMSALVAVFLLALWLASPWGYDRGSDFYVRNDAVKADNTTWFVASAQGSLRVMRQRVRAQNASSELHGDGQRLGFLTVRQGDNGGVISRIRHGDIQPPHWPLGFGWATHRFRNTYSMFAPDPIGNTFTLEYDVIAIPYWLLLLLTMVFPALWANRRRRQRRRAILGQCLVCGYDLRGTPERCPECGTPATPVESAAKVIAE